MCGRITCYFAPDDLSCACRYKNIAGKEMEVPWVSENIQTLKFVPSYNLPPKDILACITEGSHFGDNSDRVLCPMLWGLIPYWYKGEYKQNKLSPFNSRLENVTNSKLFKKSLEEGERCAVVINGFYEWAVDRKTSRKQPYYIFPKANEDSDPPRKVLFLAGLFDKWKTYEDETICSCTILTKDSNAVLSSLHHRMPVILETENAVRNWLDYESYSTEQALSQLAKLNLSSDVLQFHPVSSKVNNVMNKENTCINAIDLGEEKKKKSSDFMSNWLKTGSMKRKPSPLENAENTERTEPKKRSSNN